MKISRTAFQSLRQRAFIKHLYDAAKSIHIDPYSLGAVEGATAEFARSLFLAALFSQMKGT